MASTLMSRESILQPLRVLGVIPARGGSKSIPKKNIVDVGGKPLIAYTIEAAHKANLIDSCIVSTDSKEIASVAQTYGAEVPFLRPDELSTDVAGSLGVVIHALEFMENMNNTVYDAVVMLQPTTPFRKTSWIDEAIRLLSVSKFDSIVSVVDVGANHPYRMYTVDSSSELVPVAKDIEDPMMPRQDLPSVYVRSGDIYATRRSCLIEQQSLIGRSSGALIIDPEHAVNIDEPIDLAIARHKLASLDSI